MVVRVGASARSVPVGQLTSVRVPAVGTPLVSLNRQIQVASDASPAEWDDYVSRRQDATVYHLSGWRQVFERAFSHRTEYLCARDNGAIVGVLPLVEMRSRLFGRFMVSLPFVNYGGVLAEDDAAAALFEQAGMLAERRGLTHVELRHFTPRFPGAPNKRHKVTMILPLARDEGTQWDGLDRKVRNQVRKAEKSGLICEVGGREHLDAFYGVFATNMRDLGTPVYAKGFFAEVFSAFAERASIFVVKTSAGLAVASGIGLRYRHRFEMPWAGSLRTHRALCPNNLLYWTAVRQAGADGARIFDFGRSTPEEGTYHFKKQWGAEAEPLCWEYRLMPNAVMPDHSPKNPRFAVAIEVWKRLPVWVATLLGPPIVRSIP
jgi:FemAB-related protein (PEP-CTERM system-associated)